MRAVHGGNAGQGVAVRRSRIGRQIAPRLGAVTERANDTGGRCALWPPGNAHRPFRSFAGAATSFGLTAPFARGARSTGAVTLATRLAEGSVRVRGRVCLRTPAPDLFGSLPHQQSLAGRPVQRRFEAAEDPLADRLAAGPSGIDDQGLGAVGAGGSHAPSGSPNRDPRPCATRLRSSGFRLSVGAGRTFRETPPRTLGGSKRRSRGPFRTTGWVELPGRRPAAGTAHPATAREEETRSEGDSPA